MATISLSSEQPDSKQVAERYAARVKARLAKPSIDVLEARDGILDCFCASYHHGLAVGLKGIAGVTGSPESIARFSTTLFRRKLRAHGASFEAPTVSALSAVKDEVDHELHMDQLPTEIRAVHDQVCAVMIAKAEGNLEHRGDRSVVSTPAPKPALTEAKPNTKSHPPRISVSPKTSVSQGLRRHLSTWLRHIADQVDAGEAIASTTDAIKNASLLTQTIQSFEDAPNRDQQTP